MNLVFNFNKNYFFGIRSNFESPIFDFTTYIDFKWLSEYTLILCDDIISFVCPQIYF